MHSNPQRADEYFDRALKHYDEALRIDLSPGAQVAAIAHTAIGMAYLNHRTAEGDPGEFKRKAADKFRTAVQLKPDYWRAYVHWGRAEMAKGDFEAAVACLKTSRRTESRF